MFEVEEYGGNGRGLKISFHGVTLLTFVPSDVVCKEWGLWKSTWEREKTKVTFTFDDVISHYALVPYRKCTISLNWILSVRGVVTEPALPVKHGERVLFKCHDGLVRLGGDVGVCKDGVVLANRSAPLCLGRY